MMFLEQIPSYVFLIFFGLIILGVRQLRDRPVTLGRVLIFPLVMNVFSLYATWGFHSDYLILLGWLLGYLIVVLSNKDLVHGFTQSELRQSYIKQGSFTPLVLMLLIFVLRFLMGFVKVRYAALMEMFIVYMSVALLGGILSASLLVLTLTKLQKEN